VKSEAETRRLVSEHFYKWIQVFGKKTSEQMPTRKLWDHAIDMKEGFMLRKRRVYLLLREERKEMYKFISERRESISDPQSHLKQHQYSL